MLSKKKNYVGVNKYTVKAQLVVIKNHICLGSNYVPNR